MRAHRFAYVNIGLVILGVAVAGFWIYLTGGREFLSGFARVHPSYLVCLTAVTALSVFIRFIRWQFLLRCVDIRIPIRASLASYLASLVGIVTPAYVGEVIRAVFIRERFGVPVRITTSVWIVDRILDVSALGMIGAVTATSRWAQVILLALIAVAWLVGLTGAYLGPSIGVPMVVIGSLRKIKYILPALGISILAWVPAALLVSFAAASLDISVTPISGVHIFSTSTLLGGITLMPAGVGATGSLAISQLQNLGISLSQSVIVVSLVRITSVGVSLTVGTIFLVLQLKAMGEGNRLNQTANHFSEIASEYGRQFSTHVWDYLLERKLSLLTAALPYPPPAAGVGLDLGCGLGKHCLALGRRGYQVIGMDTSCDLLEEAGRSGSTVAAGDVLNLPFRDASLDFVYMIGVLHHLPGEKRQMDACREILRVLKPKTGLLIVHETNPRNPLFRFYMSYVFPLIKSIDEGTEWWIDPERWFQGLEKIQLVKVEYFTFVPDFVPRWLMQPLLALQKWLERSRWRCYSVHYMAVLRKDPLWSPVPTARRV
jgi:SAM-dependent methyltransferase